MIWSNLWMNSVIHLPILACLILSKIFAVWFQRNPNLEWSCYQTSSRTCLAMPTVMSLNENPSNSRGSFWQLPTHSHQYIPCQSSKVAPGSPLHHLNYCNSKASCEDAARVGQIDYCKTLIAAAYFQASAFNRSFIQNSIGHSQRRCVFPHAQQVLCQIKDIVTWTIRRSFKVF